LASPFCFKEVLIVEISSEYWHLIISMGLESHFRIGELIEKHRT